MNNVRITYEWDFDTNTTAQDSDNFIITIGYGAYTSYNSTEDKK